MKIWGIVALDGLEQRYFPDSIKTFREAYRYPYRDITLYANPYLAPLVKAAIKAYWWIRLAPARAEYMKSRWEALQHGPSGSPAFWKYMNKHHPPGVAIKIWP